MSDQYLSANVNLTVNVSDLAAPYDTENAPSMAELNDLVAQDLREMVEGYFTGFGLDPITVNRIDVTAEHTLAPHPESAAA